MCPRSDESAGKRRSTRHVPWGLPALKATLVQIAWPATRRKDSYFRVAFSSSRKPPWTERRPSSPSPLSILSPVYHLLRDGTVYQDLGMSHFDSMNRDRAAKSLVRRLQALGFEVDVRPAAA